MKMQIYIGASPKFQSFDANLSKSYYGYKEEISHDRVSNDNSPSLRSISSRPNNNIQQQSQIAFTRIIQIIIHSKTI